ncbi:hypothetical protein ACHAXA_004260 [Cyclostephanos tholiformis]|uniref:Sulfotransferase n=1 Tax=Cyclostephanos tholiformis TaxID=382380 RepID=A0ABD3RFQ2_9STRA
MKSPSGITIISVIPALVVVVVVVVVVILISAIALPSSSPSSLRRDARERDMGRGGGVGRRRSMLLFDGMVRYETTTYKLPGDIERNFLDWYDYDDDDDDDEDVDVGGDGVGRRGRGGGRGGYNALPVFWHVLKSGGTSIKLMYAQCYHLVEACETGAQIVDVGDDEHGDNTEMMPPPPPPSELRVVISEDGRKYVNVDVTTPHGILEASRLGFASSNLADVIFTPLIAETASSLVGWGGENDDVGGNANGRRGRMFAIFRHPVHRVISIFYYLQSATWEPTYNPVYAGWTIDDYARSEYCESDWMVRTLVNKMTGPLEPEDMNVAMEILKRKCLVGLMDDMEGSITRYHNYFRFETPYKNALDCSRRNFAMKGGNVGQNGHIHPTLDPNSETYTILEQKNMLDVRLYEYARELYAEQGEWMMTKKLI